EASGFGPGRIQPAPTAASTTAVRMPASLTSRSTVAALPDAPVDPAGACARGGRAAAGAGPCRGAAGARVVAGFGGRRAIGRDVVGWGAVRRVELGRGTEASGSALPSSAINASAVTHTGVWSVPRE